MNVFSEWLEYFEGFTAQPSPGQPSQADIYLAVRMVTAGRGCGCYINRSMNDAGRRVPSLGCVVLALLVVLVAIVIGGLLVFKAGT